ncbi:hypothetical protein [Neolewinella persica]|uniref:hypothetical protein n=1 Tax=Neolewinella persica TaxID=70998 RepID=UPI000382800C|nr:hypothetical protein [Neolewinella persica]
MKNYLPAFFTFLICCFALHLGAQEVSKPSPVKLLVGGALELGGDRAGWVTTEDGGTQLIRGAQGVSLVTGVQLRLPSLDRFMLHATVGYKYWRTFTDGANVRMTRIPLHLTAHYFVTDNIRVGAGVLTDRNIRFNGDGLGENAEYDPSFGLKFEVGWRNLALGYTRMNYNRFGDRERCAGGFGLTYLRTISGR